MCAVSIHIWLIHSVIHIEDKISISPHEQFQQLVDVFRSWRHAWPLASGCLETITFLEQLYNVAYGVAPAPLEDTTSTTDASVDLDSTTALGSGVFDMPHGPFMLSRWTQLLLAMHSESRPVKKETAQAQLRTLCQHMLLRSQIPSVGGDFSEPDEGFDVSLYLNSPGYGDMENNLGLYEQGM